MTDIAAMRADIRQNFALILEGISSADALAVMLAASSKALELLPEIIAASAIADDFEAHAAAEALLDRILGEQPPTVVVDALPMVECPRRSNPEEHLR